MLGERAIWGCEVSGHRWQIKVLPRDSVEPRQRKKPVHIRHQRRHKLQPPVEYVPAQQAGPPEAVEMVDHRIALCELRPQGADRLILLARMEQHLVRPHLLIIRTIHRIRKLLLQPPLTRRSRSCLPRKRFHPRPDHITSDRRLPQLRSATASRSDITSLSKRTASSGSCANSACTNCFSRWHSSAWSSLCARSCMISSFHTNRYVES